MASRRHLSSTTTLANYLQFEVESECLIGFRQVVILDGDEDGFTGFSGKQEGCSVYRLKVARVDSLELERTIEVYERAKNLPSIICPAGTAKSGCNKTRDDWCEDGKEHKILHIG